MSPAHPTSRGQGLGRTGACSVVAPRRPVARPPLTRPIGDSTSITASPSLSTGAGDLGRDPVGQEGDPHECRRCQRSRSMVGRARATTASPCRSVASGSRHVDAVQQHHEPADEDTILRAAHRRVEQAVPQSLAAPPSVGSVTEWEASVIGVLRAQLLCLTEFPRPAVIEQIRDDEADRNPTGWHRLGCQRRGARRSAARSRPRGRPRQRIDSAGETYPRRLRMPRAARVGPRFRPREPRVFEQVCEVGGTERVNSRRAERRLEPSSTSGTIDAPPRTDSTFRRFAVERPVRRRRYRRRRVMPVAEARSRVTSARMMVSARRSPPRAQPIATRRTIRTDSATAHALVIRQRGTARASPRARRLRRP